MTNELQPLEGRVADLESRLDTLSRQLADTAARTEANNRDIAALVTKIDDLRQSIRDDMKELKRFSEAFVPRVEIEARLATSNARLAVLEGEYKDLQRQLTDLQKQLGDNHAKLLEKVNHITMMIYGTFITLLLSGIGILASQVLK